MLMLSEHRYLVGFALAVISTFFIGASFIIKKIGLIRLTAHGGTSASAGGYGYLKEWIWWAGLITMGIGEICNFTAYAFAPATLVTPLGALSIFFSAIFASKFLNEEINILGKIGCLNTILGSTIVVLNAPKEGEVKSLQELGEMLLKPGFVIYLIFVLISTIILVVYFAPKYGRKNILVYILICSLFGSLSVMACKGIGLAISETFLGITDDFSNGLFWLLIFSAVITVTIQINYLNKSLDIFDTTSVTPIYYVFFTGFVMIASAILFQEWENKSIEGLVGLLCGFVTIISSLFLINAFKDIKIDMKLFKMNALSRTKDGTSSPFVKKQRIVYSALPVETSKEMSRRRLSDTSNRFILENSIDVDGT